MRPVLSPTRSSIAFTVAVLAGTSGSTSGCGADRTAPVPPRASLIETGGPAPVYPTPARWHYHPREPAALSAKLPVEGGMLYAGAKGERWLVRGAPPRAEASAWLAPEDLAAILTSPVGFSFIGQSGTVYEAREPLGPFNRSRAPLDPLVQVSAAGQVVIGVRRDGTLQRTDQAGGAWSRVGPEAVRFVDVALDARARGLALALPEALYATSDGGLTWKKLDVATFGATDIERDVRVGIIVSSAFGPHVWSPDKSPALAPLSGSPTPAQYQLAAIVPLGPSASALAEGRAFLSGGRYFEVRPDGRAGDYLMVHGEPAGALEARAFERAKGCREVRFSGFGTVFYLACARQNAKRQTQPIEFFVSRDSGRTWAPEPYGADGQIPELTIAAGADGALVVSGVCLAHSSGQGCRPVGVHHRRVSDGDGGRGAEIVASPTPALSGTALGLVFSSDGRKAYALGPRSKEGALAVFVSDDAGKTFEAHEVPEVGASPGDESERAAGGAAVVESASAAEDGTVAFVLANGDERSLLVVGEDGRVLAVSEPPARNSRIAAAGIRALAIARGSRQAWESLDGGSSWNPIGAAPLEVCSADADCERSIACYPGGCFLGDSLSRLGWHGQADDGDRALPPPLERRARFSEPKVRTPFTCVLSDTPWRSLPERTILPSANQAAIGEYAWFSLGNDAATASVFVVRSKGGSAEDVERVALLKPTARPERVAYTYSFQVEGAAALRYEVPVAGVGSAIGRVEVAWENLLLGSRGRASIADPGAYRPGDYEESKEPAQQARPALLSIGAGGLFVRIHKSLGDGQPTYFLDGRRTEVLPPVSWPSFAIGQMRSEMANVDGAFVPLRIGESALVRARRDGQEWHFDAIAVAYSNPRDFQRDQDFDIAYVGDRSGLHWTVSDRSGRDAESVVYPFRAEGKVVDDPVPVPTQLTVGTTPRRCTRAQRTRTPRIVAPYQPGTRHPVLVSDPLEPLRVLLTEDAVLFGTAAEPCVAAFDADLVSTDSARRGQSERALLFIDDLEHGWLFRVGASEGDSTRVDYRTMSCRADPKAEIPVEVYQARGTIVE